MTTQNTIRIVASVATAVASAMLVYALFATNAPYAFYQNMRVVIGVATVLDCIALQSAKSWRQWLWVPAIVIAYVHLTQHMPKPNWYGWNLAALICFLSIGIAVAATKPALRD